VNKKCDFQSGIRKIDTFREFLLKIQLQDGGIESEMCIEKTFENSISQWN
jgi:hypothetical protein